ncbi:MAG: hypothetical protein LBU32_25765 [Clostridiales bacterium]|jgi:FtsZ-binding cell division protein ZapB|nr:hypothetical protein [Clostridiales bacterium]
MGGDPPKTKSAGYAKAAGEARGKSKLESRAVLLEDYPQNYDIGSKDALAEYSEDIAEFLNLDIARGKELIKAETEVAKVEVIHFGGDFAFAVASKEPQPSEKQKYKNYEFGVDFEVESEISEDDLRRFRMYCSTYSYNYKCSFYPFILTWNPVAHSEIDSEFMPFRPIIIDTRKWDAVKMYGDFLEKLKSGEKINRLSLIYYVLSGGDKGNEDKALDAISLIGRLPYTLDEKRHLGALVLVMSAKILSDSEIEKVRGATKMMLDELGLIKWADGALKVELKEKAEELKEKAEELKEKDEELKEKDEKLKEKDEELKEKDEAFKEKDEISNIFRLYILKHSPELIAEELKLTLDRVNSVLGGVLQESDQ